MCGFVCQYYVGARERQKQDRVSPIGNVVVVEVGTVTTMEQFDSSNIHELTVVRIRIADLPHGNRIHSVAHFRKPRLDPDGWRVRLSTRDEDTKRVAGVKREKRNYLIAGEKLIAFSSTSLVSGVCRYPANSTTSISLMKTKMSQSPLR